jgi:hypothetical protein
MLRTMRAVGVSSRALVAAPAVGVADQCGKHALELRLLAEPAG